MHINLNQFSAFYLAAREKSITKTAEALHVTQPAVAMQIKSLQKNLGIPFFKKNGNEYPLTEAGKNLFSYADRICLIFGKSEYTLKSREDFKREALTIGTTKDFARHIIPELLLRFQQRFPSMGVSLKVGCSPDIAEGLMAFKYDRGIIGRLPDLTKSGFFAPDRAVA